MTPQIDERPAVRRPGASGADSFGESRPAAYTTPCGLRDRAGALQAAHEAVVRARDLLALAADEHPSRRALARQRREQALGQLHLALEHLAAVQAGGAA